MHLDQSQLETLRGLLSDRGRAVNEGLIAVQAGKPMPPGSAVPASIDPELAMDARLKQFLHHIHGRMKMIREGNPTYGVCAPCKEPLAYADLQYEPWIDRHVGCAQD